MMKTMHFLALGIPGGGRPRPKAHRFWRFAQLLAVALLTLGAFGTVPLRAAEAPKVGDSAPAFTLLSPANETVRLTDLTGKGPLVLVVLRGWPGYQCPLCNAQVQDFIAARAKLQATGARVAFIYPGPAKDLGMHALEFQTMKGKQWPPEFACLLDPDFKLVRAYGLRWEAPNETAYPATFIVDQGGKIRFAKLSHRHGDRAKAAEVLAELAKLPAAK